MLEEFNFGKFNLNKDALLRNIQINANNYILHKGFIGEEESDFREKLAYIYEGIDKGTIQTDGLGSYTDDTGILDESYTNVLKYVNDIANRQSLLANEELLKNNKIKELEKIKKEKLVEELEKKQVNNFNKYFNSKYNIWELEDFDYSDWKQNFQTLDELNLGLINELNEYIKTLSQETDKEEILKIKELINNIQENGLSEFNKFKLKKSGFSNPDVFIINSEILKKDNPEENLKKNPEIISEDNLENEEISSNILDQLSSNDKARLGLAAVDIGSAGAAYVPGGGTMASALLGITSTLGNFGIDLFDDNMSIEDSLKNLGINVGFDLLGLIPGIGTSSKASKITKTIVKTVKPIAGILRSYFLYNGITNAASAVKKITSDEELNSLDILSLLHGILAIVASGQARGIKKAKNKVTTKYTKVKTKSGKNVEIPVSKYNEITRLLGYDALNKAFKNITGEDLKQVIKKPYVFDSSLSLSLNPVHLANRFRSDMKVSKEEILPIEELTNALNRNSKLFEKLGTSRVKNSKQNLANIGGTEILLNTTPNTRSLVGKTTKSDIEQIVNSLGNRKPRGVKQILLSSRINLEKAQLVKNKTLEPSYSFKKLQAALEKAGKSKEESIKMLTEVGFYQQGGPFTRSSIYDIYVKPYIPLTKELYYNLYKLHSLTGWDENKSDANSSGTKIDNEHHGYGNNLDKAYELNLKYTTDNNKVNEDIQNFYNSDVWKQNGLTPQNFVDDYNTRIALMHAFWNSKNHEYNENSDLVKSYNTYYNLIYPSINNEIGYDEISNSILGSHTWIRRPMSRLTESYYFPIIDGNNKFYVSVNKDGTLNYVDEASILSNKFAPVEGTPYYAIQLDTNILNNPQKSTRSLVSIANNNIIKPDGIPLKKKTIFDYRPLAAGFNYLNTLLTNKKLKKLNDLMPTLLYSPLTHHKYVIGDLDSKYAGQRYASEILNKFKTPKTSRIEDWLAGMLEGFSKGLSYKELGRIRDNEAISKSREDVWLQNKENAQNMYNIAMKNRENINQSYKEKLMGEMVKHRSNLDSTSVLVRELAQYGFGKYLEKVARNNYMYKQGLQKDILKNPQNYFPTWTNLLQDIWERGQTGSLNATELDLYNKLKEQMMDIINNSTFNTNYLTLSYKDLLPEMLFKISTKKSGGYIKEVNKNYNKAVKRSVKGLYNHIKLQRKKK